MSGAQWTTEAARARALQRRKRTAEGPVEIPQVVCEWDPATGKTVTTSALQNTLLADSDAASSRRLSASGKEKVRLLVARASSLEELTDIEAALDSGKVSTALAHRLKFVEADFEQTSPFLVPRVAESRAPSAAPLAARRLAPAGLAKVRKAIEAATDMDWLATVDQAMAEGDVAKLQQMLGLAEADIQHVASGPAGIQEDGDSESIEESLESDDEYDPFTTEPLVTEKAPRPLDQQVPEQLQEAPAKKQTAEISTPELQQQQQQQEQHEQQQELQQLQQMLQQVQGMQQRQQQQPQQRIPKTQIVAAPVVAPPAQETVEINVQAFKGRPPLPPGPPPAKGALGALQNAYDESSSDEGGGDDVQPAAESVAPAKRRRVDAAACDPTAPSQVPAIKGVAAAASGTQAAAPRELAWPLEWAWLMSRSMGHPDFRPPQRTASTEQAADVGDAHRGRQMVAIAASLVYVGDAASGYDHRHLGRLAVVDEDGRVLLDVLARPRAPLLDCRGHITGLSREALANPAALDFAIIRSKLLELLHQNTLLIGYNLCTALEALHIWHGPLIDVSLLFGVDSRKQYQYHPLRHIAAQVLRVEVDLDGVQDALESARLAMKLARHEARQQSPTPSFAPRTFDQTELLVRHIPKEWGRTAAARVREICPGAEQEVTVNWLLNDSDPTDWRGEATLLFPDVAARDATFEGLRGLTDVHVQWDDAPGAPPLGSFMTEHSLIQAFSVYGPVVCARIPRKPTTKEPQSFAFISFVEREHAQRVARLPEIEVQLAPTWTLLLRARLAKFGNATDKRVPVQSATEDSEWALDYLHVCRRQ